MNKIDTWSWKCWLGEVWLLLIARGDLGTIQNDHFLLCVVLIFSSFFNNLTNGDFLLLNETEVNNHFA
jgi:hypothetical protein